MTDHRNPEPAKPARPDPAAPSSAAPSRSEASRSDASRSAPSRSEANPPAPRSSAPDRPDSGAAVPGLAVPGATDAADASRPPAAAGDVVRPAPGSEGVTHKIGAALPRGADAGSGDAGGAVPADAVADLVRPAQEIRGETHKVSGDSSAGGPTNDLHVPAEAPSAGPDERTVPLRIGEPADEPTVPFRNPVLGGDPQAATAPAMTSAPAPDHPAPLEDATVPLAVSAFRRPGTEAAPTGPSTGPPEAATPAEPTAASGHDVSAGPPPPTEPGTSTVRLTPDRRSEATRSWAETPPGDAPDPRDPAASDPAASDPAASDPAPSEQAASEPAASHPTGVDLAGTDQAAPRRTGNDPAGMDPERSLTKPDGSEAAGKTVATLPAQPAPWRRLSSAGALIWVLIALFGFTLVVQLRSIDTDQGLSTTRQEDLVRILSDLEARETRLNSEIATLEDSQRQLNSGVAGREAALAEAKKRADELGLLAGTLPGRGPGLEIRITPGGAPIKASALLNTVQELRGAGGEVMQLAGSDGTAVRVVASTSFVEGEAGTVVVDGTRLSAPYLLTVIGSPETMRTALNIPGGVVAAVGNAGGNVDPQPRKTVDVTALRKATTLQYARPVS